MLLKMVRNFIVKWQTQRVLKKHKKPFTPDVALIESRNHLVFFCDDYMKGRKQHWIIRKFILGFVGKAFTDIEVQAFKNAETGKVMCFRPTNVASPQPAWAEQVGAPKAPIRGEVFLLPPAALFLLDILFANGVFCRRIEVPITSWQRKNYWSYKYNRTHTTPYIGKHNKAWIYIGISEKWDIDAGYSGWKPLITYPSRKKEFKPQTYYFDGSRRKTRQV